MKEKICIKFRNDYEEDTTSISDIGSTLASTSADNHDNTICNRCKEYIEELKAEKRKLGAQLIEQGYHAAKFNNTCKCKLKEDIENIQTEERCLLETIELKKQRIEHLKQTDLKLSNDIKMVKESVNNKMFTLDDIKKCLQSSEKTYNDNCEHIKQKQNINIELEKNITKLKNDSKELVKKIKIEQEKFGNEKIEYKELTKLTEEIHEKIDAQKKMLIEYDTIATDFQSKIKILKSELKMLIESHHYHKQEVAARIEHLANLSQEKQKYLSLVEKAESELLAVKNNLITHENLKQENKNMYAVLKAETKEFEDLIENENKKQVNLKQELNSMKELNEILEVELKIDEDNYFKMKTISQNIKDKRCNINDELLKLINEDKEKIRQLLKECSRLELLIKDSTTIKNILERKNCALESDLLDREVNPLKDEENITEDELKTRLAKHHEYIQEIKNRFNDLQHTDKKNISKDDTMKYDWCSPIRNHDLNDKNLKSEDENLQPTEVTRLNIKYEILSESGNKGFSCSEIERKFLK